MYGSFVVHLLGPNWPHLWSTYPLNPNKKGKEGNSGQINQCYSSDIYVEEGKILVQKDYCKTWIDQQLLDRWCKMHSGGNLLSGISSLKSAEIWIGSYQQIFKVTSLSKILLRKFWNFFWFCLLIYYYYYQAHAPRGVSGVSKPHPQYMRTMFKRCLDPY